MVTESLPRTNNGKIDHQALQLDPRVDDSRSDESAVPQSPEESRICRLFADLLKREHVGTRDDFFQLGGHSLRATQVVSRIRSLFGVSLPISAIFRSPTPEALAVEVQRARASADQGREAELVRVPRYDSVFPVSYAQLRLWFLDQLEPGTVAYNVPLGVRLAGSFSVEAVRRAIDKLVARHESLRTSFDTRDGEVVQIVSPVRGCPFEVIDLSAFKPEEREHLAREEAANFMSQPFDLRRDCMLRVKILRMDESDHVLLFCIHHIASDGWTLTVLLREFSELYDAYDRDSDMELEELSIQYADFAVWQRENLRGPRLQSLLSWWKSELDGMQLTMLATDFPRPDSFSGKGRLVSRRLDKELEYKLRAFGNREHATLFMTMLAAFQVLLFRYTGQTDVSIGSPIANRNRSCLEDVIGFFVNSLVMRGDVGGNPTFRELVARVRRAALDAYEHQDLPFEQLVEALQPTRDTTRNPLFEITFAVQNSPLDMDLAADVRAFEFEITSARFDLEVDVRDRSEGLVLDAFYREELFHQATIARLLEHYENLLLQFVACPDEPISNARTLSPDEYQRLVVIPNQTMSPAHDEPILHRLFEAQARSTPDAIAIMWEGHSVTYADLDGLANRLAARLQVAGVAVDEPIAFGADRSVDMLVSILAILKAGGACLPLDPQHPRSRLLHMLRQARVRVCIGDNHAAAWPGIEMISPHHRAASNKMRAEREVHPDQAAFVLFTSGTTGKPNGVVLSHRALSNFVSCVANRFALTENDRILQFASPGFDVIIEELFPIWSTGGAVIIENSERYATPDRFNELIDTRQVTFCELPAAFWRLWVDYLTASNQRLPRCLRLIAVGCEQPDLPRLNWWRKTGVELTTVFGLTETAVTSSLCRLPSDEHRELEVPLPFGTGDRQLAILHSGRRLESCSSRRGGRVAYRETGLGTWLST